MEDQIKQVYKTEKDFIDCKNNLQRLIEQEQQSKQKSIILKTSLDALNEEDINTRGVYQSLGQCYIKRNPEELKKDMEYILEREDKILEESIQQKVVYQEKTMNLQKQLIEMTKDLKVNQIIQQMIDIDPYGQNNTGTTLIAIKYNGGVLLASDCLVTRGVVISDRGHKKVYEISPSPLKFGSIKVLGCGNSAHIQMVTKYVHNYLNYYAMEIEEGQEIKMETVVTLYKNICYNNKNFISAAFIISNGKEIYSISSGGMTQSERLYSSKGSGGVYISGFLKDQVKEGMNFYETREIAVKALALAITHDGSSGGNMRIVDLKNTGVASEELLMNKEVRRLVEVQ